MYQGCVVERFSSDPTFYNVGYVLKDDNKNICVKWYIQNIFSPQYYSISNVRQNIKNGFWKIHPKGISSIAIEQKL